MPVVVSQPSVGELGRVLRALRLWQHDGAPVQLHPGDLGWHWRLGAAATAAAVRVWSRDGEILAVGLLDGPALLRLGVAPEAVYDGELARCVAADVAQPECGILPGGAASVEARSGALLCQLLLAGGWEPGDSWTPLERDLADPVPDPGVRVETVDAARVEMRTAVQRAAFDTSTFTPERWQAMATGPAYADARCLLARDDEGAPVAAATVWSAGAGRPGLLEPVGVHRDHRGRGHGRAVALAAAAALRELGASRATVCTESSREAAVATYVSAGFRRLPSVRDLHRSV